MRPNVEPRDPTMRLRALLSSLAALLLLPAALVWLSERPGLQQLDMLVYDRVLPLAAQPASNEILIVAIDETSLAELGRWPWPRDVHARLLARLADAGARAVLLDLFLTEPSEDVTQDHRLAQAMERLPVFLPMLAHRSPRSPHRIDNGFLVPQPLFAQHAKGVGHVELVLDPDGIARSLFMHLGPPGAMQPYVGLLAAQKDAPPSEVSTDGAGWQYADRLPLAFAGRQGSYRTVPYAQVLRGELPQEFLRGKLVLVGSTAPGLGDQVVAPLDGRAGPLPGVEVHANAIDQLIHGHTIRTVGPVGTYLWIAAPLWLAIWLLRRQKGAGLFSATAVALGCIAASVAALHWLHWWLIPATPLVGLLALYLVWSWGRQRSQLRYLERRSQALQALPAGAFELPSTEPALPPRELRPRQALDRAIDRMLRLQALTEAALQAMPVGVLLCDPQGRVVGSNGMARALLGELGVADAPPPQLAAVLRAMPSPSREPPLVSGTPPAWLAQVHGEYLTPQQRHVRLLVASVSSRADEAPPGYLVALADLTSERQAQQQREQWNRFLSHDLRSPQVTILSLLDLEMLKGEGAAPALSSAIRRESQRTLDLAEAFLDVSQAWAGHYRFAPTHLGALLLDVRDQAWANATRAQVQLALQVDEDIEDMELNVDGSLLARALVNLLNNAIRHSPPAATVRLCCAADAHDVVIAVIDEGSGMDAATLQRLLSGRLEMSAGRERGEPGTRSHGLGFEFVRTVVTRHGGSLDGHAAPGAGSTFCMRLPRAS